MKSIILLLSVFGRGKTLAEEKPRETSNTIWHFDGVSQTVRLPSYGGRGWPNRHVTFIVSENA